MNSNESKHRVLLSAASPLSQCDRATFLLRVTAGLIGASAVTARAVDTESASPASAPRLKGKANSRVKRWDLITVGNLSRNRFWGESNDHGVRPVLSTCTLIQGEGFRLIIDPGVGKPEQMAAELDRRTGLKLRDIDTVFVTHEHEDHWYGLAHFPDARWLAGPEVAAALNKTKKLSKPVEPAPGRLFDAVEVIPTPGHTLGHHSVRFDCNGLSVVTAGDAVATLDFWRERQGFYNCVDFELSAKSMEKIASLADVVVPGHDNYFLNLSSA
jgi:glyoxylase-like metal-dependent hydrolase (beta-lactamase superfamily II)